MRGGGVREESKVKPARGVFVAVAAPVAIVVLATSSAFSQIDWLAGYQNGLRAAERQGKPAMIDFSSKRCRWCTKLEKETFADREVRRLAASFVCVKVDVDKDRAAARLWRVRGVPYVIFLNSGGKLLNSVHGFTAAPAFAKEMRAALNKISPRGGGASGEVKTSKGTKTGGRIFVECAFCGAIFNTDKTRGKCPRCGADYVAGK